MQELSIQGIKTFITSGTSHLYYSVVISIFMAILFSALTYYSPYFSNRKYRNTKLCVLLAFFSFIITAIITFVFCTLSFLNIYFPKQLNGQIIFSIENIALLTTIIYLLLQTSFFALLSIAAYKDIKIFS